MATPEQLDFLRKAGIAAKTAGHIWPAAAACEAAVETAWGTSKSCTEGNNLFGTKQHVHAIYKTVNLPTREYIHGAWCLISAPFIAYPDWQASFSDRMATLTRLAPSYPHYDAALKATTPEEYLVEVSQTWSTDPDRAATCVGILHSHRDVLNGSY